ncbi:TetR/AcrR family transcriptional regulator [Proteus sp. DFP240708]|uniref:TetR/AcrR family transcriptional regulator n=1 Tax=Proteus TaxID=583 RepID=UPI0018E4198D|nr:MULTISPECIES: TetR/AcrR family transcriptional regulator [Proteus]MBI6215512.1 TetR/AcrR family transcriptional regulator [Proteus vulgaris]MBI6337376.1 TetR/AcrR family transcriptional regulator [Proteus sp. PR00224]
MSLEEQITDKPRTKPAEVRLEELMNAAEALFLDKGFDATTVSDIVKKAGVAKGTYYHYFSAKTDVLDALRTRYMDWYLNKIDNAMDACSQQDHREKLKQWCEISVIAYVEKQELHDMLFHQVFHQSSNIHENRALQQIQTLLISGTENKTWHVTQPELTSTLIYHGMHAAVDNLDHSEEYTEKTLGNMLYQQFTQLLK